MADSSELSSRIDQVFELSAGALRKLRRPRAVLALLGVPAICLAATAGFGQAGVPLARLSLLVNLPSPPPVLAQVRTTQAQPAQTRTQAPAYPDGNAPRPRFDSATLEIAAAPGTPQEQFQLTLRNLLAERLQLKVHQESKNLISGYDLVVANGGPNLKEIPDSEPGTPRQTFPPSEIVLFRSATGSFEIQTNGPSNTLQSVAARLGAALDSPVTDKTGLTKRYDIDMQQVLSGARFRLPHVGRHAEEPAFYADLRSGLEQQPGLTLVEKKTAADFLVVDHVESLPSAR